MYPLSTTGPTRLLCFAHPLVRSHIGIYKKKFGRKSALGYAYTWRLKLFKRTKLTRCAIMQKVRLLKTSRK
jgi:hypothetical protein